MGQIVLQLILAGLAMGFIYALVSIEYTIIWNASVSRSFFKGNAGTLRFKIYDILKQRTNISRNIGASFTEDSEFNSLTSFFIVSFVYQFNVFTSGG